MSRANTRRPRRRRPTVTVDLGDDALVLLDQLVAWCQQTSPSTARITRSAVIREALEALYQRLRHQNQSRPEVTQT